jgi:hypothetical protein
MWYWYQPGPSIVSTVTDVEEVHLCSTSRVSVQYQYWYGAVLYSTARVQVLVHYRIVNPANEGNSKNLNAVQLF